MELQQNQDFLSRQILSSLVCCRFTYQPKALVPAKGHKKFYIAAIFMEVVNLWKGACAEPALILCPLLELLAVKREGCESGPLKT